MFRQMIPSQQSVQPPLQLPGCHVPAHRSKCLLTAHPVLHLSSTASPRSRAAPRSVQSRRVPCGTVIEVRSLWLAELAWPQCLRQPSAIQIQIPNSSAARHGMCGRARLREDRCEQRHSRHDQHASHIDKRVGRADPNKNELISRETAKEPRTQEHIRAARASRPKRERVWHADTLRAQSDTNRNLLRALNTEKAMTA